MQGLMALLLGAAAVVALAALPAAQAQTRLDGYRAQCEAYGFAPGSPDLAGCVQKLDMQQHQQRCAAIVRQAQFSCNGGESDTIGPVTSAENCANAKAAYQNECQ